MTPPSTTGTSSRRKWTAIAVATAVLFVSYGFLLLGVFAGRADTPQQAGPPMAIGLALVPFVFVALAFISRHERAPISVLKGMGLWLVVSLPVGLINPITGLVAAFGAGGIVTLRPDQESAIRTRLLAVVVTTGYVTALLLVVPAAGVFSGAVLPLAALGFADSFSLRRAQGDQ